MEANNAKRFSSTNSFISLYLVDSGKATTQKVEGKEIRNHFSQIPNDSLNAFIDKHREQSPIENYIKIELFTVSDKRLKSEWEHYAFQMASPISNEDCVLAYKPFGYDFPEGAKWISTFGNCRLPYKKIL